MIGLPPSVRVYLAAEPTDMRFGIDRLFGFVKLTFNVGMCSTPFGIEEEGTCASGAYMPAVTYQCSTPFGIEEEGTTICCARPTRRGPVLNAFRHRRGRHGAVGGQIRRRNTCSTPFGIEEEGTAAV